MVIDSALSARARVAFKIFTISSASATMSNIAISDLSTAISRKRCKIGGKLVLITNRKSYMSFRLVPKSVTVNDLEWRNGVIMVAYVIGQTIIFSSCFFLSSSFFLT